MWENLIFSFMFGSMISVITFSVMNMLSLHKEISYMKAAMISLQKDANELYHATSSLEEKIYREIDIVKNR